MCFDMGIVSPQVSSVSLCYASSSTLCSASLLSVMWWASWWPSLRPST